MDALVTAYQVQPSSAQSDELDERQSFADLAGKSALKLGPFEFCLKKNRTCDRFYFENADVRCTFDRRASGSWGLEVTVRAIFLATHSLEVAQELSDVIALAFGATVNSRLRRTDLCADFTRFPLLKSDPRRMVTQGRICGFQAQAKDFDEAGAAQAFLREHISRAGVITGFTITPGNPIMARLYDKTAELALPGREQKREVEYDIWRAAGWNGTDPVTRTEVQLRGSILDELDLRDPRRLAERLDPVWQYATNWLRLVDPKSRSRLPDCTPDLRWQAVQAVEFFRQSAPAKRTRIRGGATAAQVLGTGLSCLAASGRLPPFAAPTTELHLLSSEHQTEILDQNLDRVFRLIQGEVREKLLLQFDIPNAVFALREKIDGTRARFYSADDHSAEIGEELGEKLAGKGKP